MMAIDAVNQEVKVGEDMVAGLMFANDFVGGFRNSTRIAEAERALECTRKWSATANVHKFAELACSEDLENPVEVNWKWRAEELPIVN